MKRFLKSVLLAMAALLAPLAVLAGDSSVLLWFIDNVPGVDNGVGAYTEIKQQDGWSADVNANTLAARVRVESSGGEIAYLDLWYYDDGAQSFVKDLHVQESWINENGQSGVNFSPVPAGFDIASSKFLVELGNLEEEGASSVWSKTLAWSRPVSGAELVACGHVSPGELAIPDHTPWSDLHFYAEPELHPVTTPVVHLYDGTGYAPGVSFPESVPYEWYPVYSMESNGVYSADLGQTNVVQDATGNVIPTNVFVRIVMVLPETGESVMMDSWTGVNTVTILPRPVVITADSAEKTYDGDPLTDGGYTVSETTATTGFVAGEGVTVIAMTEESTITEPGSTKNVIDGTQTVGNDKTKLSNYDITYVDGTLTVLSRHHEAEPLIAEFSLAADNGSLQTMRIWTTDTIEAGDLVYICGAKTYADAKAGNWVSLADSACLVDDLAFDAEHIAPYKDIVFTDAEAAEDYRFFLPCIRTWEGDVFPGSKYVGIVDVEMDPYGETAAGVPFARCLSTTKFNELAAYYDPDIPVTELVQTNTLHGSRVETNSDQLFLLSNGADIAFDWYSLDAKGNWNAFEDDQGRLPPAAEEVRLPRGTAFNIKRPGDHITGVIRLHGQVDEKQVSWTVAKDAITQMSSGIPGDLDLNDREDGVKYPDGGKASITYMDAGDYTYVISYGNPGETKDGSRWYRTQTKISKGKRTTVYIDPPLIPPGRVFWFTDGTTDNPAITTGK